jgi:hypothetical protein
MFTLLDYSHQADIEALTENSSVITLKFPSVALLTRTEQE